MVSLEYFRTHWRPSGKLNTFYFSDLRYVYAGWTFWLLPANSYYSWRFITKQTVLYRNRSLNLRTASAQLSTMAYIRQAMYSCHTSQGSARCPSAALRSGPAAADVPTHASAFTTHQTKENRQCFCSPSLSRATTNSRWPIRFSKNSPC